nr:ABC transporter ATP-binding protein [uncultured Desulfobacter sp.]
MSDATLIKVEGVSKKFCRNLKKSLWYGIKDLGNELLGRKHGGNGTLRPDEFWAVNDVNFELKRGECLGLIGHNGAGKTTLLRMLNGLIKPDAGRIEVRGRIGALIALGAGFNPVLTGRENIYVNAAVLGLSKSEIDAKFDEIVKFSELEEFIDAPVQSYSSGMQIRLGFAVASTLDPDVLILDEVLAVGDLNFQSKCLQRVGELVGNAAVILVSHYPHHIKKMCNQLILLDKGRELKIGDSDSVLETYQQLRPSGKNEPFVLLEKTVIFAKFENISKIISSGDFLEFDFVINLKEEVESGQAYLNIVEHSEIVHAQVVLSGLIKKFPKGISRHHIKVGPLHLSTGHFSGNFVLYGSGGKTTIAHLRHCMNFNFKGASNLGPVYYPPSYVQKINGQKSFD